MGTATRTTVLIVDPAPNGMSKEVEDHLARHGLSAEIMTVESRDRRVADIILDETRQLSPDLVVMGAYGHTRLREQIFGGATLSMLTASESPILVAH
jgi:nucleotide-binding universal stress UspA family protein